MGIGYGSGTSSQAVNVMAAMAKAMTLYSIFFIVICFYFSILQSSIYNLDVAFLADEYLPGVVKAGGDADDVHLVGFLVHLVVGQLVGSKLGIGTGTDDQLRCRVACDASVDAAANDCCRAVAGGIGGSAVGLAEGDVTQDDQFAAVLPHVHVDIEVNGH